MGCDNDERGQTDAPIGLEKEVGNRYFTKLLTGFVGGLVLYGVGRFRTGHR